MYTLNEYTSEVTKIEKKSKITHAVYRWSTTSNVWRKTSSTSNVKLWRCPHNTRSGAYVTIWCPSVRPSVCPVRTLQAAVCGGSAAMGLDGSTAARPAAQRQGARQQMRAMPRWPLTWEAERRLVSRALRVLRRFLAATAKSTSRVILTIQGGPEK